MMLRARFAGACSVGLILGLGSLAWDSAEAASLQTTAPATDWPESVVVYQGQSRRIDVPWKVKGVSLTDPAVAEIEVLTPTQLLLRGKSAGSTDLHVWSDEAELRTRIDVRLDLHRLEVELAQLFADSRLTVTEVRGIMVIRGTLSSADSAADLHKFCEAAGIKYVNMATVAGPQQVLLRVRVAEVSRTALRAMAFNAFHVAERWFGGLNVGSSGGPFNAVSIGVSGGAAAQPSLPFIFNGEAAVSPAVTLFAGFPHSDVEFFLQALAENQYLRVLAEPNLVALSGEEASFLAGGEFPIPVVQGTTTGGGTSVSVEYREFGVRLSFRPTVLGDGSIRLFVAPEVSNLSDAGAVEVSGFRIPALVTRRAAATLRLNSGETFAMAGLLNSTTNARRSVVPVLGDVPIIGTLFRSVRYQQDETELVVLVTASLVEPLAKADTPLTPGALHQPPNDWAFFVLGDIEAKSHRLAPGDAERLRKMGFPWLVGPGAWESHEQGPARSRATIRSAPASTDAESHAGASPSANPNHADPSHE